MNLHYKTVVNYVKNLFPGCAPVARSKTAYMDARVLSQMALDTSYIDVGDKHKYWCCLVNYSDIPVARYIMRSNGLNVSQHYSLSNNSWFLRVPADHVEKDPSRRVFISAVMDKEINELNDVEYQNHLLKIRQRMK